MKYAVIVVGYNREESVKRLLKSIQKADYCEKKCDLVISIDYSAKQEQIVKIADDIKWNYGKKVIRAFSENQGLKKHIIQCGDLTNEYDVVIVLEDDLVVSESFFKYVIETVEFYKNDTRIAGISLYTHRTNPGNGRPFEAQYNGYDVFLMQYAQSWGQCWTKKMWKNFKKWYEKQSMIKNDGVIPEYVVGWDEKSWLKYYIRYVAENNLFYVYPYFSLTTNTTGVGVHNKSNSTAYQVPLVYHNISKYKFPDIGNEVKYDSYFERIFEKKDIGDNIMLDLYGLKKQYHDAEILISTNVLNYEVIRKIELQYRPHELNCINQEDGEGIYIYNLKVKSRNKDKRNLLKIAKYDFKAESTKLSFIHAMHGITKKIKNICKKIIFWK